MKKIILALILLACFFWIAQCFAGVVFRKLQIRNTVFKVEIASSTIQKAVGLSYRSNLLPDHGMLFVLKEKDTPIFWMKGMQFPLDFLWIDGNKVVDISENVPTPKGIDMRKISPRVPIDNVLELNAGTVKKFGITIGDTISFLENN